MSSKVGAILFIGLAAGLSMLVPAQAAILYVDKDNACPGNGLSATPFCSIQNAVNVVNAGDTVRIRDAATPYNETIQSTRTGTAGNPIRVEPDIGHNPQLRNSGNGGQCAVFWIQNADYWTIQNLTFDAIGVTPCVFGAILIHAQNRNVVGHQILNNYFKNWGGPQADTPAAKGMASLVVSGGSYGPTQGFWPTALVKGNTFDGNRLINITLAHTRNVIIENNEFKNTTCGRDTDNAVNELGVKAIYYNDNLVVRDNIFHDFSPYTNCTINDQIYATYAGYWCDVGTSGASNIIENNTFYNIDRGKNNFSNPRGLDQSSTAIFIEHECYNHIVRNNIIYNIGSMGIRNRQDVLNTSKRNKYYNNTIYSVAMFGMRVVNLGGVDVKNNLFFDNGISQINFEGTAANIGNHLIDYNLYYDMSGGNKVGMWGGPLLNFTTWKSACKCDSHSLNVNPLFINPFSDFGLQESSPAKGAGEGGVDLGAYAGSSTVEIPAPGGLRIVVP